MCRVLIVYLNTGMDRNATEPFSGLLNMEMDRNGLPKFRNWPKCLDNWSLPKYWNGPECDRQWWAL